MLKIKLFTFNMFSENTIIIWDDESRDAAIVDPGTSSSTEENELLSFISSKDLRIKYLINTHCHIDHILGCSFVKEKFNPVYYAPELDLPLLDNAQHQAQMFDLDIDQPPIPDKLITEQTEIMIGESKLQFLFTPGHTPGEFCIYIGEEKICVTGDVLFKESIGRTDLWGGNYETLLNSIHEKLFLLPDDVIIYPGHGEPSTIGYEKQNNPFLV
ncbi:MAG: MBL fold metallo-hydrolase [Ignavibacteriota bacterium]|nr:MAG: MBL fold metallo-hydrolase [Chlorobiota bacterium]MBE7478163.1 MBL fold metallo-hydrolase [Ignavibacteriales bacterium]MBL1121607.1 MBL fold metallo-hydrolase [Ignavibacteriota bacterium]MCC7093044.1 MBL fold metallo-hydrolase [Ignavibacteriaceae bacterium]MCE7856747.1 MBL fold metallo-hydrolase [Ignavibacteria bacterium CHB3]MEB2297087.1 MBL fold metallo-hydrolase [Ignavibacteria bacterium]